MKMKHLNIFALAVVCAAIFTTACNKDEDPAKQYKEWRQYNENWLNEQLLKRNDDGSAYFTRCNLPTDNQQYVWMHNIGQIHTENLKPLFTSTTKVNYTLKLANDSVVDKGAGFVTQLNSNALISGWGVAVMQLHVGDSAQFIIPYASAYGTVGTSTIPPYSNLVFNMRLTDIVAYEVRP